MNSYTIKGIISAERPCECCGNRHLEKNVVLQHNETGELKYVGTTCASYLLTGKNNRKESSLIGKEAEAHNYAEKWIGVYGDGQDVLQKIADVIRARFCPATVWNGRLLIGREMRS